MRRFQNQRPRLCGPPLGGSKRRVDQRDRTAIAMSQQDWQVDMQRLEQTRQHHSGFMMHKAVTPRLSKNIRRAMPVSRISHHAALRGRSKPCRKIPPQGNRSQAFVQHYNDWSATIRRRIGQRLQAVPVDSHFAANSLEIGRHRSSQGHQTNLNLSPLRQPQPTT